MGKMTEQDARDRLITCMPFWPVTPDKEYLLDPTAQALLIGICALDEKLGDEKRSQDIEDAYSRGFKEGREEGYWVGRAEGDLS